MLLILITGALCCIPLCLLARVGANKRYALYYDAAQRGDMALLRYFDHTGYIKSLNHRQREQVVSAAKHCNQRAVVEYFSRLREL